MDQEEKLVENNKPAEISYRENQVSSRAQRYRGEKTATGIGVENNVKITQDANQDDAELPPKSSLRSSKKIMYIGAWKTT